MAADEHPSQMERVADSALLKAGARVLTPILLTIISVLLISMGTRYQQTQDKHSEMLNSINNRVGVMDERINSVVLRQVETNTHAIAELRQRVERLERSVRTP